MQVCPTTINNSTPQNVVRTSLIEDCITPSPTFDFPSFIGDDSFDVSKAEDETSLVSLNTQSDFDTQQERSANELLVPTHLNLPCSTELEQEDYHGLKILKPAFINSFKYFSTQTIGRKIKFASFVRLRLREIT